MIFFSDMDGTFLTSAKTVPAENWAALDALAEAGGSFVPCTGRAFSALDPHLLAHPAVRWAVCSNGASVYEAKTGRLLRRVPLDRARLLHLWDLAQGRDVVFDLFAGGRCYSWRPSFDQLERFVADPVLCRAMRGMRTPVDESLRRLIESRDDTERATYLWRDPADRDYLLAELGKMEGISVVRSLPMNLEVSAAGATKGTALAWLCDHVGESAADAVAFGDSINDLSMLEAAGCGVAMANAEPEAKAVADVVCAGNDEAGVGRFIMARLSGGSHAAR